jgi:predicted transcriptional regulator
MRKSVRQALELRLEDDSWAVTPLGMLARYMIDRNLSSGQIADELRIDHTALCRWLRVNRRPGRALENIVNNERIIINLIKGQ